MLRIGKWTFLAPLAELFPGVKGTKGTSTTPCTNPEQPCPDAFPVTPFRRPTCPLGLLGLVLRAGAQRSLSLTTQEQSPNVSLLGLLRRAGESPPGQ